MKVLEANPVLMALHLAQVTAATQETRRAEHAAYMRRSRSWDRVLGFRADGARIRPIPNPGMTRYGLVDRRFAVQAAPLRRVA